MVENINTRPYQEKLTFQQRISKQEMILYPLSKAHSSEKQKLLTVCPRQGHLSGQIEALHPQSTVCEMVHFKAHPFP